MSKLPRLSCLIVLVAACLSLSLPGLSLAQPVAAASGEEAETAAKKWLEGLGMRGLVIDTTFAEGGLGGRAITGTTSYMYVLNQDGWYVNLGFSGKIDADSTLDDLRGKFKYIALDRVPTPGLKVPGWEIKPRTPVSSFKDGVEFVSFKEGQLTVKVKTRFFALYGRNPNVLVPADAPSPRGSYFQIRQNFPLDLTLTATVTNK